MIIMDLAAQPNVTGLLLANFWFYVIFEEESSPGSIEHNEMSVTVSLSYPETLLVWLLGCGEEHNEPHLSGSQ